MVRTRESGDEFDKAQERHEHTGQPNSQVCESQPLRTKKSKRSTVEHIEHIYQLYGSLSEGGQVRKALDELIADPQIDQRVSHAVREMLDELRSNERIKHTTRYEFVLYVFLLQPDEPTPIQFLSKFFEGSPDPDQAVRNLLGRLDDKLEKYSVRVQHTSAYQLAPAD